MEGVVLAVAEVSRHRAVGDRYVLHLALAGIVHERGEGDLLLFAVARALLDDLP
jgi:hypothetical protein